MLVDTKNSKLKCKQNVGQKTSTECEPIFGPDQYTITKVVAEIISPIPARFLAAAPVHLQIDLPPPPTSPPPPPPASPRENTGTHTIEENREPEMPAYLQIDLPPPPTTPPPPPPASPRENSTDCSHFAQYRQQANHLRVNARLMEIRDKIENVTSIENLSEVKENLMKSKEYGHFIQENKSAVEEIFSKKEAILLNNQTRQNNPN